MPFSLVLSLLVVRLFPSFSIYAILVRCHCKLYLSVAQLEESLDGAGIAGDSVPNFQEPIDFYFHEHADSGSGKSNTLSIDCLSQFSSAWSSLINGRTVSFLSSNVSRRLVFSFKSNHQFTMENLFEELIFTLENIQASPVQEIDSKIAEVVHLCLDY